jgi:hypothetical protein
MDTGKVVNFLNQDGQSFTFQHDNARPHTERLSNTKKLVASEYLCYTMAIQISGFYQIKQILDQLDRMESVYKRPKNQTANKNLHQE